MKTSNFSDVGQMRSRSGTSMKRMTRDEALFEKAHVSAWEKWLDRLGWGESGYVQTYGTEDDDQDLPEGHDVGDAHGEAEYHANDAGPDD
jgi:hypothetical protein